MIIAFFAAVVRVTIMVESSCIIALCIVSVVQSVVDFVLKSMMLWITMFGVVVFWSNGVTQYVPPMRIVPCITCVIKPVLIASSIPMWIVTVISHVIVVHKFCD